MNLRQALLYIAIGACVGVGAGLGWLLAPVIVGGIGYLRDRVTLATRRTQAA